MSENKGPFVVATKVCFACGARVVQKKHVETPKKAKDTLVRAMGGPFLL